MGRFSERSFFLHTSTFTIGIALIVGGHSYVAALGWILAIIGILFFSPGVDGPGGITELSLLVLGLSLFSFLSDLREDSLQLVQAWGRPSDLKTGVAVFIWGQSFLFARDRWIASRVNQVKGDGDPPTLASIKRDVPNQLPDPTSPSVTPPANAVGAPSVASDH
jgi:hypothetical protein